VRVLMLAPRTPFPPDYGAAQRNLQLVQWLGRQHDLTLLTYGDPRDPAVISALEDSASRVEIVPSRRRHPVDRARALFLSTEPDLARRLWSAEMNERLSKLLRQSCFDLVQIEGLEMYSAWDLARRSLARLPLVVLDEHNAEYVLQESAWRGGARRRSLVTAGYSFVQAARLRRYERRACQSVDGVLDVSSEEDRALKAIVPGLRSAVIPNGVDTDYYQPATDASRDGSILFIGKMDYRPNVDAVEWLTSEIWPVLRNSVPNARLNIVGRDPLPRVTRLAETPGVSVVGAVADDRPWFSRAAVLAVPMRMGGGVRLKVLQALATGTAIVATSFGMSGVGAVDGVHFLLGDSPVEFSAKLALLLGDPALRTRLSEAGRALARDRFDWRTILPRLDDFHRELRDGASRS
jgi:glycosyltransferase involved in cell wall biosynthesis